MNQDMENRNLQNNRTGRYFVKHREQETPLFFGLYGGEVLLAQIDGIKRYEFLLRSDLGKKQIKKTDIQFCYNALKAMHIYPLTETNETIKQRRLQPIIKTNKRYKINQRALRNARREKRKITVTMRGGEVFCGEIKWFDRYEIKLVLDEQNDVDLLLFRHAIYNLKDRSGD